MLFCWQPPQENRLLIKVSRLCELSNASAKLMTISGIHNWKHGGKVRGFFGFSNHCLIKILRSSRPYLKHISLCASFFIL
ncbi:unnamed protein product [Brassica oleracea]|uniref:(rape) hypothetical protein n=1 Tax=Brassica napus TaxID=3708 RepID=A0A816LLH1_BRANA|nr:unnamed protein product [Brassica napus]